MQANDYDPVCKKEFNCGPDSKVIKHQHIVKYQHNIINELSSLRGEAASALTAPAAYL